MITQLKNLSDTHDLCILIVHHTRKQDADDCFEKISGTNGLMGCADGAMIMTRKRGDPNAKLQITGRDQQDQIINLEQDPLTLIWKFKNADTTLWEEPADPVIEKVCRFIETEKIWSGTASELIADAGLDGLAPNALARKLNSRSGPMFREKGIRYVKERNSTSREIRLELMEE